MVLDANTYGTIARVQVAVGDLVPGRAFGPTTTPTLGQVELILDEIADELNSALKTGGYTVPVVNSGEDVFAFGFLSRANSAGAACEVLNTFPSVAFDPDNPDPTSNRKSALFATFKRCLDQIIEGTFVASKTTGRISRTYVGSFEDSDGNTKNPIFKRNQDGFPGTRSLKNS